MSEWRQKKIEEFAKVISGYAFKSATFLENGDIPVIKIKNIRVGYMDLSDCQYVDKSFLNIAEKYKVRGGDILISLTGSHMTQPNSVVGRSAMYPYLYPLALLNQRAGKIDIFDLEQCDSSFLYYCLSTQTMRERIAQMSSGAASQANVSPSQIESMVIMLPPLDTQRKIASVLSAYDDQIENNTRRIKALEEAAQALYREWFVEFRYPGHEDVPLVESELGMIPQGWEVKPLGDVADVNALSIKKDNTPEHIKYINISSVTTGQINVIEPMSFVDAPGRARRIVKHGDTIWSMVRPNLRSYALIINPEEDWIASTGFAVISPHSIPYTFGYYTVTSAGFVGYLTNHATGAAYPAVKTSDFEKARITIADDETLGLFHAVVEDMVIQAALLRQETTLLREARDKLLPRLVSGEIDVSELDVR